MKSDRFYGLLGIRTYSTQKNCLCVHVPNTSCIKLNQKIWIQPGWHSQTPAELSVKTDEPPGWWGGEKWINFENGYWYFVTSLSRKVLTNLPSVTILESLNWLKKQAQQEVRFYRHSTQSEIWHEQPYLEDQLFTTIVHAPYVLKTNGQVTGQDAVSTTVQGRFKWQMLVRPETIISEYLDPGPHQCISGACLVATK